MQERQRTIESLRGRAGQKLVGVLLFLNRILRYLLGLHIIRSNHRPRAARHTLVRIGLAERLAFSLTLAHQRPWPGDNTRTVVQAFAEEQPRLLPLPQPALAATKYESQILNDH